MRHLATAAVVLALAAGMAIAHSKKESSVPADGSSLAAAPETILLNFDSPTMVTLFRITDGAGAEQPFDGGDLAPALEYQVAPAALSTGTYSVEWRGLSSDGHPVEGAFTFTVQ